MYDIIDLLQVPLPLQVSSSPARADEFAANIGQPAVRQIGYHLGTVPYKFYHLKLGEPTNPLFRNPHIGRARTTKKKPKKPPTF